MLHGFACKTLNFPHPATPALARPEPLHAPALKAPHEAGRRGGESIARQRLLTYIQTILTGQILLRSLKLELRIKVNPLQYPSIWLLSM